MTTGFNKVGVISVVLRKFAEMVRERSLIKEFKRIGGKKIRVTEYTISRNITIKGSKACNSWRESGINLFHVYFQAYTRIEGKGKWTY